jgi:hypothetical protein
LGNGQCYDTHLGVIYSCSGESQTPNPGEPGGQTPNPGHPGIQTPNPVNPGIQTPNPGYAGSSNSGGSNIITQIRTLLGSILTGGNLQKHGQHDQQKYSSIRPIIGLLNPMNVGLITGVVDLLNPLIGALQGDSAKIDETGGLLTGIADLLLRPIIGAGQGESAKIDETGQNKGDKVEPVGRGPVDANYCKQFPNDARCRPDNTGGLPDEFKEAQDAQVGCMLTFAAPATGGWAAVAYHSFISPAPYEAVEVGTVEALKHSGNKSVAKAAKYAGIVMSIPDCIKFAEDSGIIGQYGLTKDLGLNKLSERIGLSPGPSDTSKGRPIVLSCHQFPGQSIDEIKRNCQKVSENQTVELPTPSSGPAAPNNVHIESFSGQLQWTDNSDNEDGFRIYQNDNLVGTAPANATTYQGPLKLNCADVLIVSAYNANGESTPVASSNKPSDLLPSCR